jgi:hypothetical protein
MAGKGNRGMKSGRRNLPATTSQKMDGSWVAASEGKPEQCHVADRVRTKGRRERHGS